MAAQSVLIKTMNRFFTVFSFFLIFSMNGNTQEPIPLITYEFDQSSLEANGWQEIPGGFTGKKSGTIAFKALSASQIPTSTDGKGLVLMVAPDEVCFLFASTPVNTHGNPVLMRMTVRAELPNAAVALAALKGNPLTGESLDGSMAAYLPAGAAGYIAAARCMVLTYEPDTGEIFTPAIQVAATGPLGKVTIFIDKLEIYTLSSPYFSSRPQIEPNPTVNPIPSWTPTLSPVTPTPGTTPMETPTVNASPTTVSSPSPELYTPTATDTPVPLTPTPQATPEKTIRISLPHLLPEDVPLEMALIPPGTFIMGSPVDEVYRDANENPQHQVTLSRYFYIGKYEITQAQWHAVMNDNPATWGVGNNFPVSNVTWQDCQHFIERLNQTGQGTFRLPTEAEWEYCCRAGTTSAFYWGEDPNYSEIDKYAWFGLNAKNFPHEVGTKNPNPWGLYDMSGNVVELCWDWFWSYPHEPQIDPQGPATGMYHVIRGGSWYFNASYCRSARRDSCLPENRDNDIGFRIVRDYP